MADTRFVIYAQARTGSTLLADLLNYHPDITCDFEVLGNRVCQVVFLATRYKWNCPVRTWVRRSLAPHWQMALRACRARTAAYGFKLMVHDVARPGPFSVSSFHARGWQIFSLRRRNLWRQALSTFVANHNRRWQRRVGDPPPPPVAVTWPQLRELLDSLTERAALEARDLRGVPHVPLIYEEDLETPSSWPACVAKLHAHLGLAVAEAPARANVIRSHEGGPEQVILNHAELVEAAARSSYAHLVEEC